MVINRPGEMAADEEFNFLLNFCGKDQNREANHCEHDQQRFERKGRVSSEVGNDLRQTADQDKVGAGQDNGNRLLQDLF